MLNLFNEGIWRQPYEIINFWALGDYYEENGEMGKSQLVRGIASILQGNNLWSTVTEIWKLCVQEEAKILVSTLYYGADYAIRDGNHRYALIPRHQKLKRIIVGTYEFVLTTNRNLYNAIYYGNLEDQTNIVTLLSCGEIEKHGVLFEERDIYNRKIQLMNLIRYFVLLSDDWHATLHEEELKNKIKIKLDIPRQSGYWNPGSWMKVPKSILDKKKS